MAHIRVSCDRTEEGHEIEKTQPWDEADVKLPQEFSILPRISDHRILNVLASTYNLPAFFFTKAFVWIWYLSIDDVDRTGLKVAFLIRRRLVAGRIALLDLWFFHIFGQVVAKCDR